MKAFVYTELYGFELNRLSCTDKVVFLKVQHVDVDTGQELNSGYSYFEKWLASRHYYVISLESSIRSGKHFFLGRRVAQPDKNQYQRRIL